MDTDLEHQRYHEYYGSTCPRTPFVGDPVDPADRLRADIRSLISKLRTSATPQAIGSERWYVDLAIATLEKMIAPRDDE